MRNIYTTATYEKIKVPEGEEDQNKWHESGAIRWADIKELVATPQGMDDDGKQILVLRADMGDNRPRLAISRPSPHTWTFEPLYEAFELANQILALTSPVKPTA